MNRFFIFIILPILVCCTAKTPAEIEDNSGYTFKKTGITRYIFVKDAQSLSQIANDNGVPMQELARLNHLNSPYHLRAGQKLKIPTEKYHKVVEGETLLAIADIYDVRAGAIAHINDVDYPYEIYIGQNLKIPNAKYAAPTKSIYSMVYKSSPEKIEKPKAEKISPDEEPSQKLAIVSLQKKKQSLSFNYSRPLDSKNFQWPVKGKVISHYGKSGSTFNEGVNIAAKAGSPVKSAGSGKIIYAGNELEGYGNLIIIKHHKDYMSAYAHNARLLVKKGDAIKAGQKIATVGKTGNVKVPQLHFSIRKGKRTINPDMPL